MKIAEIVTGITINDLQNNINRKLQEIAKIETVNDSDISITAITSVTNKINTTLGGDMELYSTYSVVILY